MKHFEFTDAEHPYDDRLRQIKATKFLRHLGIYPGEVGGWIASEDNLAGEAWVAEGAVIYGENVRVSGEALITGKAELAGNTVVKDRGFVSGRASLYGDVVVKDHGTVTGAAFLSGIVEVSDSALIEGVRSLQVSDDCKISGSSDVRVEGWLRSGSKISGGYHRGKVGLHNADLSKDSHVLSIGPVGSESCTALIYRTSTEEGHTVKIGCWSGAVGELAAEVERRNDDDWLNHTEDQRALWRKQYYMVEMMARHSIDSW